MNTEALTLVVADDHPLFRTALRETVRLHFPRVNAIEADSLTSLREALARTQDVDLVLLDLRMPGASGFSSLMALRAEYPAIPVIVVSAAEEALVISRARDFGAAGFIPKSAAAEGIAEALETVLGGGTAFPPSVLAEPAVDPDRELARKLGTLTPQQLRVLGMIAAGLLNKQIAGELDVTEATVKAHVTGILRKLGIYRRTQAALITQRLMSSETGPLWSPELVAGNGTLDPED
ncbi:MAG: response regulator [Panacagrimonas sp.]